LAFRDLSSLRTHFWPFTEVVRKIRRKVTRKIWSFYEFNELSPGSKLVNSVNSFPLRPLPKRQ